VTGSRAPIAVELGRPIRERAEHDDAPEILLTTSRAQRGAGVRG
jgi:hypothetical protein